MVWLRKNKKAIKLPNDEIGRKIGNFICDKLQGEVICEDDPVYWDAQVGSKNIDKYNLPQTSWQYTIEIARLPELYTEMNTW